MQNDVFNFRNPIDFLSSELELRKMRNSRFSLRAWARQLNFKNPAFLSQILAEKRSLSLELAKKMSRNLKLNPSEAKYFEILVLCKNARSEDEKDILQGILDGLSTRPPDETVPIDLDTFKLFAEWQHMAILEIVNLKNFDGSRGHIVEYLSSSLNPQIIEKSVERLLRLGFLKILPNGKICRAKKNRFVVDQDKISEAIQIFHRQMIDKALQAIEEQTCEQRDLRSTTVCMSSDDYLKAKKILAEAHTKISNLSRNGDGELVYQINSQLFQLAQNKGTHHVS